MSAEALTESVSAAMLDSFRSGGVDFRPGGDDSSSDEDNGAVLEDSDEEYDRVDKLGRKWDFLPNLLCQWTRHVGVAAPSDAQVQAVKDRIGAKLTEDLVFTALVPAMASLLAECCTQAAALKPQRQRQERPIPNESDLFPSFEELL